MKRAVFTIAVGKPMYLRMAVALARSFKLWHRDDQIRFFLATDAALETLPRDLRDMDIIPIRPGEYGKGFAPKLHLDKMALAEQSLFVDADCLCVGSLEPAFECFRGRSISVIGREIADGEWFGDVAAICRQFGVPALPRFNGGVYYLERGEICHRVYQTARELEPRYDAIGFVRLRGGPNEEVLIALAMALHGQKPIPERGDIMSGLMAGHAGLEIDVFKGHSLLRNPTNDPGFNYWRGMEEMHPTLVHFLNSDIGRYPYHREEIRLRLVFEKHWPVWAATLWARLTFSWPWIFVDKLKSLLRPVFHATFGPRKIRSDRL